MNLFSSSFPSYELFLKHFLEYRPTQCSFHPFFVLIFFLAAIFSSSFILFSVLTMFLTIRCICLYKLMYFGLFIIYLFIVLLFSVFWAFHWYTSITWCFLLSTHILTFFNCAYSVLQGHWKVFPNGFTSFFSHFTYNWFVHQTWCHADCTICFACFKWIMHMHNVCNNFVSLK